MKKLVSSNHVSLIQLMIDSDLYPKIFSLTYMILDQAGSACSILSGYCCAGNG